MKLVRGDRRWRRCRRRTRAAEATGAIEADAGCVTTIGNFDGLHRGHAAMLEQLGAAARERDLPAVVTTFDPLPREHFAGGNAPRRLHGLRDRIASLAAAGVDAVLLLPFDDALASLSPEAFIERILVDTLAVRHLVIGDDFRFGHRRRGTFETLLEAGERHGFSVERNATISDANERISSTRVREALADGELDVAARLLGRPYRISGRVIHGEKVGRQLGFPTANVALDGLVPPLAGVFAVRAHDLERGTTHAAVANLGERPTVGGRKLLLEIHVLDGAPELYGNHLAIDFERFLRGERRFDSLDDLKAQIALDAESARAALA